VILLEVRASNAPALALYRGLGFSELDRRARYYTDTGEDAVVMQLELR
jgi:[ribosomal protein S18]-alanine N-acetyltransferase